MPSNLATPALHDNSGATRYACTLAVPTKTTGRQPGNLSRTLKTMSRFGLMELRPDRPQSRAIVDA